jgi:hypothetical protein
VAHELGHELLEHGGYSDERDRQVKELEAEAVYYCLTRAYGVESSHAVGYIAHRNQDDTDNNRLRASSERIRKTVQQVLEALA